MTAGSDHPVRATESTAEGGRPGRWASVGRLVEALPSIALFAMMIIAVLDVVGRKAWGRSVPGAIELSEVLMILVIFMALPLVSARGQHIQLDLADDLVPFAWRRARALIGELLTGACMLGGGWFAWQWAERAATGNVTSTLLGIPMAPFFSLTAALFAATFAVHLVRAFRPAQASS